MDTITKIKKQIRENQVIIYMKGSPKTPDCGFSKKAIDILSIYVKNFAYINILINPDIRTILPSLSNWPTFPQIWIQGKFIGGCDIINELHNNGQLDSIIKKCNINKQSECMINK